MESQPEKIEARRVAGALINCLTLKICLDTTTVIAVWCQWGAHILANDVRGFVTIASNFHTEKYGAELVRLEGDGILSCRLDKEGRRCNHLQVSIW